MELQYFGANCVRITSKKANIVIDDNLSSLGLKSITKPEDITLTTNTGAEVPTGRMNIDMPGEYEVSDVSVQGVAARAHMDEDGKKTATMFKLVIGDIRIAVVGHIHPDLTDTQLEALGTIDVLVIPVGDSGYTLDAIGALKVIKEIEPKVIVPTHYADKAIKYPVSQVELSEVLKVLSMEPKEPIDKLKIKTGELPDITQLVILERQ